MTRDDYDPVWRYEAEDEQARRDEAETNALADRVEDDRAE